MNCSLGDDGIPSYGDTCSFTCNTSYELTGSGTRTCQSGGRWSGIADVCRRGVWPSLSIYTQCLAAWNHKHKITVVAT